MTLDTSALISGVQDMLEQIFEYVPVALAILGPVVAIGIGFAFGGKIANMIKGAFGGSK
jgi:hypothetical protein